jgi:hypothetical protein
MRRQLHLDVVDRTPLVDGSKGILSLTAKPQKRRKERKGKQPGEEMVF